MADTALGLFFSSLSQKQKPFFFSFALFTPYALVFFCICYIHSLFFIRSVFVLSFLFIAFDFRWACECRMNMYYSVRLFAFAIWIREKDNQTRSRCIIYKNEPTNEREKKSLICCTLPIWANERYMTTVFHVCPLWLLCIRAHFFFFVH